MRRDDIFPLGTTAIVVMVVLYLAWQLWLR